MVFYIPLSNTPWVGWWNNSLGLTSDAVHMLFDSTAIIFSLIASVVTKWDSNHSYSYGFGRVETLTGFINALALVFASGNIMWEAFERLFFEAPELKTHNLLLVSVLGLLVNIGTISFFNTSWYICF
jgi:zinc transporter 5/7